MELSPGLEPVAPAERVVVLDVLRGAALSGVLIANIAYIFSTIYLSDMKAPPPSWGVLDHVARYVVQIFVASKAMTMLSFLFGLGFATILVRAADRGEDGRRLVARRLGALFIVGACHVAFLWQGDVTWIYATCGLALLLFRHASDRALLIGAVLLIFVPHLVLAVPELGAAVHGVFPHPPDREAFRLELLAAIHGTDYPALMWAQIREAIYFVADIAGWLFFWVIGRFLLGYYAGRRRIFDGDGTAHLPFFRRLLRWSLAIAILGAVWTVVRFPVLREYQLLLPARLAMIFVEELTVLATVAVYTSAIVLLLQRPRWRRVLTIVAPCGRMPLTTYLSQSLFASFIFFGWGLDLAGRAGPAACLGIALGIFAVQIVIAHLWLRRFRFGPAEWAWRSLAYGRLQPMRRA